MLSLGRFRTEIDLCQHRTLRESFRYAKLIGPKNDEESLEQYSDELFALFIKEQLIYFSNSRSIIDGWISMTGDLFDDIIMRDTIPINELPAVQRTTLVSSTDENCKQYIQKMKKDAIQSALKELDGAVTRCRIPTSEQILGATKEDPLTWDALESFNEPSTVQCDKSFQEQKLAIKSCIEAIDEYADIGSTNMIKSRTICGYAGSGKSWCM